MPIPYGRLLVLEIWVHGGVLEWDSTSLSDDYSTWIWVAHGA